MTSLRSKLILWNTAILALGLVAVGGTIVWLNLSRMREGIDRELYERSRGFGGPGRGPGPGGPPGMRQPGPGPGPGMGMGQGPRGPGGPANEARRQEPPPGNGQLPPGQAPESPRFMDPQAERIGAIRRPRILDSDGRPPEGLRDADLFDPGAVGRMRAEGALYSNAEYRGESVRVYTAPAERLGDGWVVQVARELRDYRELARVQWLTILTVLPLGVALAALGGRFLTARAMRPIAMMGEEAARIGAGEFGRRVAVEGNDEFAALGRRFNEMAESLGLSFAQQQAAYEKLQEAFEQQRRFVADASHELRTPLTRLQLTTSAALEDPAADSRSALKTADDSARAMAKLVGQLLDLAQADAGALRPFREELDLRAVAADVVSVLPVSGAPIRVDTPDHPVIAKIDPMLIGRALTNLLENALRHTPTSGKITVTVAEGSIAVSDTGEGIPEEHLARVRERFYRVDTSRTDESGGTGLGLAIVDEIMRAHGGSLQVESKLGKGTRATLRLP